MKSTFATFFPQSPTVMEREEVLSNWDIKRDDENDFLLKDVVREMLILYYWCIIVQGRLLSIQKEIVLLSVLIHCILQYYYNTQKKYMR